VPTEVHDEFEQAKTAMIAVLEGFCSAFERRDGDAVLNLVGANPALIVVTSEEAILRSPGELEAFLRRYEEGSTTYSWTWDRFDAGTSGSVGWLLAQGWETASTADQRPTPNSQRNAYRMTMAFERRDEQWIPVLIHGSSPHQT
jgi:hypothetical protein